MGLKMRFLGCGAAEPPLGAPSQNYDSQHPLLLTWEPSYDSQHPLRHKKISTTTPSIPCCWPQSRHEFPACFGGEMGAELQLPACLAAHFRPGLGLTRPQG